jgi:soluble lytic murein transglycosylase-like protein
MSRFALFRRPAHRPFWLGPLTAFVAVLFLRPAPLIGDSEQNRAFKAHQVNQIRTAVDLQQDKMSDDASDKIARSIATVSQKYSVDPLLVVAVIQVESRFDHQAVSSAGAQGLMQIQPAVVSQLIDAGKISPSKRHHNIKDPRVNIEVGVSYLAYMQELFGDLKVALTAYNNGPSWVRKKLAAREPLPTQYANKVLSTRRALMQQLAAATRSTISADSPEATG